MAELAPTARARMQAVPALLRRSLWPLVLVGGIAAESFVWRAGQSPQYVVYDLGIGFVTVFVTLAIWEARPRNLVGPLLFVWAAWFVVSPIRLAHVPAAIAFSWLVDGISGVCFAHAMLASPTGRLAGRLDRTVVGFAYAAIFFLRGAQLLWSPPQDIFDGELCCTTPPPFAEMRPSVGRFLDSTQTLTLAVLLVAFIALVVRKFLRARPRERHLLFPVMVVALLFAIRSLAGVFLPAGAGGRWDASDILDHVVTVTVAAVFLLVTYRSRVERANVADIIGQLGAAQPSQLQPMLASALSDPDLRLDLAPQDDVVEDSPHQVVTPIHSTTGDLLARLHHDGSVVDDRPLLRSVVAATRLALENAALHAQVMSQLEDVRASRARLVEASDAERRRLERNLHDGAQQRLLSLGLALQLAQQCGADGSDEQRALLADAQEELTAAITELRELGRGINPAILTDHGLASAVHTLANRCAIPVRVLSVPEGRWLPNVETAAYYVIAEALQNVVKHAHASEATVALHIANSDLHIEVCDDGRGGAEINPGGGLHGLADRVEAIGGTLTVHSDERDGTRLVVRLPCASS